MSAKAAGAIGGARRLFDNEDESAFPRRTGDAFPQKSAATF
jgi:hypothetical protein